MDLDDALALLGGNDSGFDFPMELEAENVAPAAAAPKEASKKSCVHVTSFNAHLGNGITC